MESEQAAPTLLDGLVWPRPGFVPSEIVQDRNFHGENRRAGVCEAERVSQYPQRGELHGCAADSDNIESEPSLQHVDQERLSAR